MSDWWCPYCNSVVAPENVTYEETHDPRSGGCGGTVFGTGFTNRIGLEDQIAALQADNAEQAERIKALEADRQLIAQFIFNDPPFDSCADVDIHDEAYIYATALGREESNADDYYAAFLTCAKSALQAAGYGGEG